MTLPHRLARAVYSALLIAALPAYFLKLWWRGRSEPLYRCALAERRGRYQEPASSGWVWVHAVSLGETRAAAALVEALRRSMPGLRLLLTHGTATGRAAGAPLLRAGDRQVWLPFDTPGAAQRFMRQFSPLVGVLMETEIWPNLLFAARSHGVPMVLANARLSEKSRSKGAGFDALLRPAVASLARVLAQSEDDAERLRSMGAQQVRVSGNLKFDMPADDALLAQGRRWREAVQRPLVLAASTREGEEAMLLWSWQRLNASLAGDLRPLLVIVPRHPQRFDEVAALVRATGMSLERRSDWRGDGPDTVAATADVWLGDSLGEMPLYYAAADVALLGGSFAPLGGQNLIEAAACGCVVVMGPHTFNFADAAELALRAGAAQRVDDIDEGVAVAAGLAAKGRQRHAEAALRFAGAHRGAAQGMADDIAEVALAASSAPKPA